MDTDKLRDATVSCPFCGHPVHLDIDPSMGNQDYQDECRNCGSDIRLVVDVDEQHNKIIVRVKSDDENYY
ncbi:hypothetical protein IDSA_04775 [Pseudidiomarina salinarum]|uniref:Zn-ribbon protein n=1 Tax=Pseudidiomarina salinarum TaxID=435908 RepID=A0A094IWD2_9GAMM|nr:CPXCG motif-containing cysteine-rich protein [Pseudidiomarina salinarum]KFZ31995.1 hypothetical protein IDSA_04775 [Pseudidiomarina salinarum]RUO70228.1 CPXCG motif-containing cysteine-rich protein [Pseudidiomarina salinarum]